MSLTKASASLLIDLVENKLAMLQIDGREDLREVLTLQHCLEELRDSAQNGTSGNNDIPRRGRHRKLQELMVDVHIHPALHRKTA